MSSLIKESTDKIKDISIKGKEKINSLNETISMMKEIDDTTEEILKDKKLSYDNKISDIQYKIDNFNISYIQDRIEEVMRNKSNSEIDNKSLIDKIEERIKNI